MKKLFKLLLYTLGFLLILSIFLVVPVDRTPYQELSFYERIDGRLDSLLSEFDRPEKDSLRMGFSKISITPSVTVPLAGYSGRDPMEFSEILDSVFVRTVVLTNGTEKAAILSAEILIFHPEVADRFYKEARKFGWSKDEIFLNATHTHSSIGGWSPGLAGEWVTGEFDSRRQDDLVEAMFRSLRMAETDMGPAGLTYANTELGIHVRNRLIKDGEEDAWARNLFIKRDSSLYALTTYSAHATCFNAHSNALTGDYPSYYTRALSHEGIEGIYLAGAVGSMGPEGSGKNQKKARLIGTELANQVVDITTFDLPFDNTATLSSFKIEVPLRSPQLKISRNLRLRPWVFNGLLGRQEVYFSVLKTNENLLVGLPCDFSGELAIPLYDYAKARDLNLILTSFNGGYIGYVTKDEWYDLEKYETRTMNWYGPDSGAYFSEIIRRIIDAVAE